MDRFQVLQGRSTVMALKSGKMVQNTLENGEMAKQKDRVCFITPTGTCILAVSNKTKQTDSGLTFTNLARSTQANGSTTCSRV